MGLGNDKTVPNMFDIGFANGELDSPLFAI